jgi:predicted site-specific integrase-resolvase
MKATEACELLSISISTLKRLAKKGEIRTSIGANNHNIYWDDDVYRLLHHKVLRSNWTAVYCRVPGRNIEHQDQMTEQEEIVTEYAVKNGLGIDKVYRDYCASTEWSYQERPGIWELLKDIMDRKVAVVVIESRDRLAAIGWELWPFILKHYQVETVVVNKGRARRLHKDELIGDITEMLTKASASVKDQNVVVSDRISIPPKPKREPEIDPRVFPEKTIYESRRPTLRDDLSDLI